MAQLKTKSNDASVSAFLHTVKDEHVRADCFEIVRMMEQATKAKPKMWGTSIVGFGSYHYKSPSGREGDWMLMGFSPRQQNLTLYGLSHFKGYADMLEHLGKHTTGKGCLYFKKLADVDKKILKEILNESARAMKHAGT